MASEWSCVGEPIGGAGAWTAESVDNAGPGWVSEVGSVVRVYDPAVCVDVDDALSLYWPVI